MASLQRKARVTGLLYLGLALAGGVNYLVVRPMLFVADDPAATVANLSGILPRLAVVFELLVVLTKALTAVAFHHLFHSTQSAILAAFGLVNAVAVLISAALLGAAVDAPADGYVLYLVSGQLWTVAALFFGLWLIPMGQCVLGSGSMPRPLGWLLVAGGIGYVLSGFAAYLAPDIVADLLTVPASAGEFWMIGYLVIRGLGTADRPAAGTR
jgi:hypothetical protein